MLSVPPPPIVVPLPSPVEDPADFTPYVRLVSWQAGAADCGEEKIIALRAPRPLTSLASEEVARKARPVTFSFKIDRMGRPISIIRQPVLNEKVPVDIEDLLSPVSTDDLAPTLAVSAFPAGSREQICKITYSPNFSTVASASLGDLIDFILTQREYGLGEVRKLLRMPPSNCDGNLTARVLYFPPLDEISGPPGELSSLLVRFNVDAAGAPIGIEVLHNSTGKAVESSVVENLAKSRFAPKARADCLLPLGRVTPDTLAAPVSPPLPQQNPKCPFPAARLLTFSDIPFPQEFRRRNVEGWAQLRFDIATSGKVSNVSIIAAEPADTFGTQGRDVVEAASAKPRSVGLIGCVARVVFRLDDESPKGISVHNKMPVFDRN